VINNYGALVERHEWCGGKRLGSPCGNQQGDGAEVENFPWGSAGGCNWGASLAQLGADSPARPGGAPTAAPVPPGEKVLEKTSPLASQRKL